MSPLPWLAQLRHNARKEGWRWALKAEWRNLLLALGLAKSGDVD